MNVGNIYYKQCKFPLAIKMYRMALDQTPNIYKETRYRILRNIGNAFMRLGQFQVPPWSLISFAVLDIQLCLFSFLSFNRRDCGPYNFIDFLGKTKLQFGSTP